MRRLVSLAAPLVAVVVGGCAVVAEPPPQERPAARVPRVVRLDPDAARLTHVRLPVLARDSAERRLREITLRVRNESCLGVATGSAFALDSHTLVTNRHVLAGADRFEIDTWDGHLLAVRSAAVGRVVDVGIATVDGTLPRPARLGGPVGPGASIVAVGYPLGGPWTLSRGTVVDLVDGSRFGVPWPVLRLTAAVAPGSSGGPVLDARGDVVAVVFAIEVATRLTLAIPIQSVRDVVARAALEPVPPCGRE